MLKLTEHCRQSSPESSGFATARSLFFDLKMSLNFLKKSSFLTVPTLYLLYLHKRDTAVQAKELEKPLEPPINKSLPVDRASPTDNGSQRLPNVPIIALRRSKYESINLVEALRVLQNAPGVVCGVSYRGEEIWSFGNGR